MKYFIKFHATHGVMWLEQETISEVVAYVEYRYGKHWRNLFAICRYQEVVI